MTGWIQYQRSCCLAFCFLVFSNSLSMAAEPNAAIMGNYEGYLLSPQGTQRSLSAQIVATAAKRNLLKRVTYKATLHLAEDTFSITSNSYRKHDTIPCFKGRSPLGPIEAEIVDSILSGSINNAATFRLHRVERKSPTLNSTPPQGALVLFAGKNLDTWMPSNRSWCLFADGAMEVGKGNLISKQKMGSGTYHIEFCIPFIPEQHGQDRGNSGIYLQGRYEIQILDSFGQDPKDTECGSIYKQTAPKVNACLPPTEWQTFDITFRAPQFNAPGTKSGNARITVLHNGISIHENMEIKGPTPGGISDTETKSGPLMLQDHNCKVQYRNLWYVPAP